MLVLLAIVGTSCISKKKLTYLQDSKENPIDSVTFTELNHQDYQVQANDILNISIKSYSPGLTQMFNTSDQSRLNGSGGDLMFYLNGYSVSAQGEIVMPVVGNVYVLGKTITQIKEELSSKLKDFFTEESLFINVQLAGIRYTVVGDVAVPGKYIIFQNQANIFEAIANAGDITMVGDRKQVQIIRQTPDGVKFYDIDLTDKNVISNPNFFVQPNDIINVKPLPQKSLGIGTTGFQTFASILGVLASSLSVILTLQNIK